MGRQPRGAIVTGRRVAVLAALLVVGACVPDEGRRDPLRTAFLKIVAAEDARPTGGAELDLLVSATRSSEPLVRGAAVRALGRLEQPDHLETIAPLLVDPDAEVRTLAADAVAQALRGSNGDAGAPLLLARVSVEREPVARAAVGHALGRLDVSDERFSEVERALLAMTRSTAGAGDAPDETLVGVLLGLEDATRRRGLDRPLSPRAVERVRELFFRARLIGNPIASARVRELTLMILAHLDRVDPLLLAPAFSDPNDELKVRAVRLSAPLAPDARSEFLRRALADASPRVRLEAVGVLAADPRSEETCARLFAAAGSSQATAVRLRALDALAVPCADATTQRRILTEAVAGLDPLAPAWHVPAHALAALARLAPAEARRHLPGFAEHPNPFVRAWAARAAGASGAEETVRSLSADSDPNVRTAAVAELFRLRGHAADGLLREQLGSADPQLVLTAARLLSGSPQAELVARDALDAFRRLSAARRDTWRDPRMALLALVGELGGPALAPELEPYLSDYDEVVAQGVARILGDWTGRDVTATPSPRRPLRLPSPRELRELEGAVVRLHMRRGGSIDITLLPLVATTNAFRFASRAREGYFDGLTFHRVASNFVIQGGSPGANEYAGDDRYTRDEVSLISHWRGSVGLSTRGHDTGDGQIFIDLVNNIRLDHAYTIFGIVTGGMEVADAVLEGDVIERAEVRIPE